MIEIVPITRDNWRQATAIAVADGQLRFIADHEPVALVLLSKAYIRVGDVDWWPFVIEDAGETIGVFGLADERDVNAQVVLYHLLIDGPRQRCGYGRSALRSIIEFARHLERCHRLRLTVHPQNHSAIALYRAAGFASDGLDGSGELRFSILTAN